MTIRRGRQAEGQCLEWQDFGDRTQGDGNTQKVAGDGKDTDSKLKTKSEDEGLHQIRARLQSQAAKVCEA